MRRNVQHTPAQSREPDAEDGLFLEVLALVDWELVAAAETLAHCEERVRVLREGRNQLQAAAAVLQRPPAEAVSAPVEG